MSVIPDKKDYKNVDKDIVSDFTARLAHCGYELISHVLPNEKSHFDRYGLVKNAKRTVIVYDVKAAMLSVTAFGEQFREVCEIFDKIVRLPPSAQNRTKTVADEKTTPPAARPDNKKTFAKSFVGQKNEATPSVRANKDKPVPKTGAAESKKKSDKDSALESSDKTGHKTVKKKTDNLVAGTKIAASAAVQKPDAAKSKNSKTDAVPKKTDAKSDSAKNDFALKKYTTERFNAAVESLKEDKIKIKLKSRQGSASLAVDVYEVSAGGSKLTVSYMPEKKILQIQGKATDFSRKVQTLFSESVDYKSAVNAHIEQKQTDERAGDVEKRLKKYLPVGCMYLSSQAKIDFSIGIVDLLSGNIVLSDYSSLLIPPYRGLEKFIFDLEQAQGIKVKMIGQAYEKNEDGKYVLKAVYRKRIGSIVFAEVMSALYTEYNSTRNFYVHSAAGAQTKVINDKNQAIAIYENMLSEVEYNAKKLREIGFTMQPQ